MRKRTLARELALQILYQLDLRGPEILKETDEYLRGHSGDPEVVSFASTLIRGTWEKKPLIDAKIEEIARNWQLHRMAAIDRNILRLGTYELLFLDDIPPLVTLNESIELAKKYSTKNSGPFVNGILDSLRLRCAPPAKQKKS